MKIKVNQAMKDYARRVLGVAENADDNAVLEAIKTALVDDQITPEAWKAMREGRQVDTKGVVRGMVKDILDEERRGNRGGNGPDPHKVFAGSGSGRIRVRGEGEKFRTDKAVGKHKTTGQPVLYGGAEVLLPSEEETAKCGVFLKRLARKAGLATGWTEHDEQLWQEMVNDDTWVADEGQTTVLVKGERVKALLEDSTSGGTYLVPLYYDDALIVQLLLNSEIAPYIDLKDIPYGKTVQAESMGTPTVSWGTPEGTNIMLFDTTNLIAPLTSSIYAVTAAIEVGRDQMADTPIAIGEALQFQIGEKVKAEMDRVIAVGDGVTQPQGLFTAAGITTVTSANGNTGPVTLADAEALIFGLGKPYRNKGLNPTFVANDITYRRFRSMPQGSTLTGTRALGLDTQAYEALGYRFAVQNDIPNQWAQFVCLKRYRLWRRQGVESRWVTEGKTLALANTALLLVRGRFGGRLVDSNAAVQMTDLPL